MKSKQLVFIIISVLITLTATFALEVEAVGSWDTQSRAYAVDVSGDIACIADYQGGLVIVDISDPERPRGIAQLNIPGFACGLAISGENVYVSSLEVGIYVVDLSNPRQPNIIGSIQTQGGANEVAISGDFAYVAAMAGGLRVINIENPRDLREVDWVGTREVAREVYISGEYAYVACNQGGLDVVDISDPENVRVVGNYDSPGNGFGITVNGQYAYLADYDAGLKVINVEDPEEPELEAALNIPQLVWGVTYAYSHVFVANHSNDLRVFDASDPGNLELVSIGQTVDVAIDVVVQDNYVYVADHEGGLRIFEITGIGLNIAPNEIDFERVAVDGRSERDITVSNHIGEEFEILRVDVDGEYFSIDFQAPEFIEPNAEIEIPVIFAPEESGNFEGTITVFSDDPRNEELTVAVSGSGVGPIISVMGRDIEFGRVTVGQSLQDDVLIRNRGLNNLIILDVNIEGQYFSTDFQDGLVIEPGGRHEMIVSFSPEEDGNFSAEISITSNDQDGDVVALDVSGMGFNGICFETPGSTHDLCVRDDMIFLADGRSGLQIVDIHDPYNPELVGELDLPGEVFGLEIHDDFAYLAIGISGFQIVDISDLANPEAIGRFDSPGSAQDITVRGDYAYIADEDGGLRVVDVFDPTRPAEVASLETPGIARGIHIEGQNVFLAIDVRGLMVVDISDPETPVAVGNYNTPGWTYDVEVRGNFAYLADERRGLRILNIENIEDMVEVGFCVTGQNAYGLQLDGNYAYIADGDGGLVVIDIINPAEPQSIRSWATPDVCRNVCTTDVWAVVATSEVGMIIYDISEYVPHPEIFVDAARIDFGRVLPGDLQEETIRLSNIGDLNLTIREMNTNGDFFSIAFDEPIILEPGSEHEVTVTFAPQDVGVFNCELAVLSDDPLHREVIVSLCGFNSRELTVSLIEGWNMISINVSPTREFYLEDNDDGPDVEMMFEQLRIDEENHHVILVKDEFGRFYNPEFGFSNIPHWNLTNGYLVNVDQDLEAVWTGVDIPADTDIPLETGWNIAAYFPQFDLDASQPDFYVISPIIENVIIAKDRFGRFITPEWGFSNMERWHETEGYMIKANNDIVFNYPPQPENNAGMSRPDYRLSTGTDKSVLSSENMSILINVETNNAIDPGEQIFAYSLEGKLVGSGMVDLNRKCGLAVWGDDVKTEYCEGLLKGETFTLFHESRPLITSNVNKPGSGLWYEPNGLLILECAEAVSVISDFRITEIYPNPFNSSTRISFSIPVDGRVNSSLFDISGRMVTILTNKKLDAGEHTFVWDASEFPTGIYILQVSAGDQCLTAKVTMIK